MPRRRKHNDEFDKKEKRLCRASPPDLRGIYVHVDPSLFSSEDATKVRTRFGMRRAYLDFQVGMYVVPDPTCAGQLKTWSATLGGCRIADPKYFASGGTEGVCLSFRPQIVLERKFVRASVADRELAQNF